MTAIDVYDAEAELSFRHLRAKKSSDRLLENLFEHHDYSIPSRPTPVPIVIEIKTTLTEMAEPIPVCILPIEHPRITVDAIKYVVAKFFGLSHSDIISERRTARSVQARQIAMYLCRKFTTRSMPFIGRKFGDRDHTTVHHAVHKIERLLLTDELLAGTVASIEEIFAA